MNATTAAGALLTGRVSHSRLSPTPHAFAYRLFMLRLDLDAIPALDRSLTLFGLRWWKPLRFDPADFLVDCATRWQRSRRRQWSATARRRALR